jgi:hypothetical protein
MTLSKTPALTIKTLAAAALLGSAVTLALAQAPGAANPAKKELVAKVLQLQQPGFEMMSRALLQRSVAPLIQGAGQQLQQMPADKREAAAKALDAEFKKFFDESTPLVRERVLKLAPSTVGALLEERFNEDELKQIIGWLESPVFKKYGQLGGEMEKALAEKLVGDIRPTLEPKAKALEQSVMKQLGITPKPAASAPAPAKK